jgi:hypothetical protein
MAESDDKKDGDSTRAGAIPPPRPPLPPSAPPPAPPTPAAPPAPTSKEDTAARPPSAPPRLPQIAVPDDTAAQPAPAPPRPPQPPAAEEEGTMIMARSPVRLTHLKPAERYAEIPLEPRLYRIGRAASCDIRLYSPAASREHARLRRDDAGWVIEPEAGKTLSVEGVVVEVATVLSRRARLKIGDDELLFVDESQAATTQAKAPAAAAGRPSRRALVAGLALAALIAFAVLALLVSR